MSYLLEDMVKTAGWLVDKEKRQRVMHMKHLGHNLKNEKWDGRRMKGQADLLQPEVDVLRNKVEHAQKGYSDALAEKYKKLELEEQLNPTMYDRKEPNERLRARLRIQFNGPEWEKLREAEDEHSKVDGKFSNYADDAKRHQRKATDLENDIKSQAKEYGEGFFGPNPKLKKDLQRKERRIVGAGIAGAAAIGGGAYLNHRYNKKKRAEAEQEKTAAGPVLKDNLKRELNDFRTYNKLRALGLSTAGIGLFLHDYGNGAFETDALQNQRERRELKKHPETPDYEAKMSELKARRKAIRGPKWASRAGAATVIAGGTLAGYSAIKSNKLNQETGIYKKPLLDRLKKRTQR